MKPLALEQLSLDDAVVAVPDLPVPDLPAAGGDPEVRVVRSARRRTTVAARLTDGVLQLSIPSWMTPAEEQRWVEHFLDRTRRQLRSDAVDLGGRTTALARRYGLPTPSDVRFVDNMGARWGSCTPSTGEIRISRSLLRAPTWVLDYVVVHELAHLLHPDHGAGFWGAVHAYPKAERAIGFLQGWGMRGDDGGADEPPLPEDVGVERRVAAAERPRQPQSASGPVKRRRRRRRR